MLGASSLLLRDLVASARSNVLGLLSSLLGLSILLLVLTILDGLSTSGLTGLGSHGTLLLDDIEGSTNNSTLVLNSLAGSLLVDLLSDTLLVLSAVENSPRDSSGVLSLLEKRCSLGGVKSKDLGVTSDEELALLTGVSKRHFENYTSTLSNTYSARVDLVTGK